ncbi:MAG TPA: hypothetical protein PLP19_19980 [bacterium]|nr:hypothetical protein [bacterium]HPN45775.1 hypothetical protein [bacterium]
MRKLFFLLVITLGCSANAKDIFNVHFGINNLPNKDISYHYYGVENIFNGAPTGHLLGFSVPININDNIDIHIKLEKGYHYFNKLTSVDTWGGTDIYDKKTIYTFHVNELLIGKSFHFPSGYKLLPQLGYGYTSEGVFEEDFHHGIIRDNFWFVSASLVFAKEFKPVSIGYLLHVEKATNNFDGIDKNKTIKIKTGLVFSYIKD